MLYRLTCLVAAGWLFGSSALAQTTIGPGSLSNLSWVPAGNPYQLTGKVIVPAGSTLDIAPGVRVELGEDSGISVVGNLLVRGTENERVTFTKFAEAGWRSVNIETSSTTGSSVRFADFDGGFIPITIATQAPVTVEHSTFTGNSDGVLVLEGVAAINACEFSDATASGVGVATKGSASITNTVFRGNRLFGVGVSVDASSRPTRITNCTFFNTTAGNSSGIDIEVKEQDASTTVARNVIIAGFETGAQQRLGMGVTGTYLQLDHSNFWDNTVQTSGGASQIGESISADPLFISDANLRLQFRSPSLNSGTPAEGVATDFDGRKRPSGPGWDMGAFELQTTCGNSVVEVGERCDDGASNGQFGFCNDTCTGKGLPCGDGTVDPDQGEECDDGNTVDDETCSAICTPPGCGDALIAGDESCDDGNDDNEDACLNTCIANVCNDGFLHRGVEVCDDGNALDTDGCTTTCTFPGCGDGEVESPEECDDGNASNNDECLGTCIAARCGDGVVQQGVEECDDGKDAACDMCRTTDGPTSPPTSSGGCVAMGGNADLAPCWILATAATLLVRRRRKTGSWL